MRLNRLFPASLLVLISPLAVIACCGSGGSEAPDSDSGAAADVAASEALGYIPSPKAGEHMGEEGTVRGTVKDYQYVTGRAGRPYVLLFDKPGVVEKRFGISGMEIPETFTVVIWKDDRKNFPSNFAASYVGKTVCVTGLIEEYDGSPAIVAKDPSQLKIDC